MAEISPLTPAGQAVLADLNRLDANQYHYTHRVENGVDSFTVFPRDTSQLAGVSYEIVATEEGSRSIMRTRSHHRDPEASESAAFKKFNDGLSLPDSQKQGISPSPVERSRSRNGQFETEFTPQQQENIRQLAAEKISGGRAGQDAANRTIADVAAQRAGQGDMSGVVIADQMNQRITPAASTGDELVNAVRLTQERRAANGVLETALIDHGVISAPERPGEFDGILRPKPSAGVLDIALEARINAANVDTDIANILSQPMRPRADAPVGHDIAPEVDEAPRAPRAGPNLSEAYEPPSLEEQEMYSRIFGNRTEAVEASPAAQATPNAPHQPQAPDSPAPHSVANQLPEVNRHMADAVTEGADAIGDAAKVLSHAPAHAPKLPGPWGRMAGIGIAAGIGAVASVGTASAAEGPNGEKHEPSTWDITKAAMGGAAVGAFNEVTGLAQDVLAVGSELAQGNVLGAGRTALDITTGLPTLMPITLEEGRIAHEVIATEKLVIRDNVTGIIEAAHRMSPEQMAKVGEISSNNPEELKDLVAITVEFSGEKTQAVAAGDTAKAQEIDNTLKQMWNTHGGTDDLGQIRSGLESIASAQATPVTPAPTAPVSEPAKPEEALVATAPAPVAPSAAAHPFAALMAANPEAMAEFRAAASDPHEISEVSLGNVEIATASAGVEQNVARQASV